MLYLITGEDLDNLRVLRCFSTYLQNIFRCEGSHATCAKFFNSSEHLFLCTGTIQVILQCEATICNIKERLNRCWCTTSSWHVQVLRCLVLSFLSSHCSTLFFCSFFYASAHYIFGLSTCASKLVVSAVSPE